MNLRSLGVAIAIGLAWCPMGSAADLPSRSQAPAAPRQAERGIWAAIAYSAHDGKHGFFWGADKRTEAESNALKHCERAGGRSCSVVTVFRNHRHWDDNDDTGFPYHQCGALAVSEERSGGTVRWGAQSATTRREAEGLALRACEASAAQCDIREWVCT